MGGLFSRLTVWGPTQVLTATALNNEFNNIITNFIPQEMQGYSANVAQMQVQTNPGTIGSESLAASLSGEIERLRYVIAQITGNSYWYVPPSVSLAALNSALGANIQANSISSGLVSTNGQPVFLVPSGSTNSVTLQGASTPFVYRIGGNTYTISTNVTLTGLSSAPNTNNTLVMNDPTLASGNSALVGENGSTITVATMGSSVSALTSQLAAFKTDNGTAEYVLCRVESSTSLTQAFRGYFYNSSSSLMGRQTTSNGGTWTLEKLAWIYANTGGGIQAVYTNPTYSSTAPNSPASGDMWYDFNLQLWQMYNGTAWVAANATLIGLCITTSAGVTVGARSFDFFETYSNLNTIELFPESTSTVRAKYPGGQISVYGTTLQFGESMPVWSTSSSVESGQSLSASTMIYFYVSAGPSPGNTWVSPIAPFDRRGDLQGFYHPSNPWRCLGWAFYNASSQINVTSPAYEVESLFRNDNSSPISLITGAAASYPLPYNIQFTQKLIECNATSSAFTQVLPPPQQWRGNSISFVKTDGTTNAVTIQAFGTSVLSTTGNLSQGSTTISSLAATTGLSAGVTYMISGQGIQPGTTVVWTSGSSATLSQAPIWTNNTTSVVFALSPGGSTAQGIQNNFSVTMNTQNEMWTFFSDGQQVLIQSHYIPGNLILAGTSILTMTGTAGAKGTVAVDSVKFRRVGDQALILLTYAQTAAGTAGTGLLVMTLPNSFTADVSKATLPTTAPDNSLDIGKGGTCIGSGFVQEAVAYATQYECPCTAFLYSSTQVYFVAGGIGAGTSGGVGTTGGSGPLHLGQTQFAIEMQLSVPILGWWG